MAAQLGSWRGKPAAVFWLRPWRAGEPAWNPATARGADRLSHLRAGRVPYRAVCDASLDGSTSTSLRVGRRHRSRSRSIGWFGLR